MFASTKGGRVTSHSIARPRTSTLTGVPFSTPAAESMSARAIPVFSEGLKVPDVVQAACAVARGPAVDPSDLDLSLELGRDLLFHCGSEMNHLARFLPEIHAEFS